MNQDQLSRLNAVMEQLDEHLQLPKEDNRRKLDRVKARFGLLVMVLAGSGPMPLEAFSRNISPSGIAFVSRRPFQSEERIAVSLKIPGHPAKLIFARVTFSRYLRGGLYEVGAEFLESASTSTGEDRVPSKWIHEAAQQRLTALSKTTESHAGTEKKKPAEKGEKEAPTAAASSPEAAPTVDTPPSTQESPEKPSPAAAA